MAFLESWQEVAMLSVNNGTAIANFALITESFDINNGEKNIEGQATVSGGRIVKWTPEGDTEITCKIIPVGVSDPNDTTLDGFWQHFQPQSVSDTSYPRVVSNSRLRTTVSVAILWCQAFPASVSNAFSATASSHAAYRICLSNAYITKNSHSFTTDAGLTADVSIKCPAFDKNGVSNVVIDDSDGSAALVAK